jgi:hypothetical protein
VIDDASHIKVNARSWQLGLIWADTGNDALRLVEDRVQEIDVRGSHSGRLRRSPGDGPTTATPWAMGRMKR